MTETTIPVPCGRCPACYSRRASAWSFRLMQEEKRATSAHFLTLTYDTQHSPITNKGYMSLDKRDIQLFFKRLRKDSKNSSLTIKYYAVGEYGGKSFRPHYHVILFNADIQTVQPNWNKGSIHYGTVTGASIGYTLKYMSKRSKIPTHANDDRLPEFALMSKGLGAAYLTPQMVKWHLNSKHDRMYCNTTDGKKISMPRYYKQKIYSPELLKAVGIATRQKMLEEQAKKEPQPSWEKAEDDLAAFRKMDKDSIKADKL